MKRKVAKKKVAKKTAASKKKVTKKTAKKKAVGKKTGKGRGRPTLMTAKIVDEILTRVAEGEPLALISRDSRMPAYRTICKWQSEDELFRKQVTSAMEHGTHYLAADCLRIADDRKLAPSERRVMIDTRIRLIGKWNSRKYGDHLRVTEQKELEDATPEELEAAIRQRLEGMRAQGIDVSRLVKILGDGGD